MSMPPVLDMPAEEAPKDLRGAAVRSIGWQGLSHISGKVLVLVSTVILAKLLDPKDFGVVALALVFITYADVITDLGAAEALVFLPRRDSFNDTAVTISLLWSALITTLAWIIAPNVAVFFHEPEVTPLFRALSISLLLGGIAQVPDALLRKQLAFRRRMVADLARAVGQGTISILLAVAGFGPWAIVVGYIAGDLLWGIMAWALVDYRPRLRSLQVTADSVKPLIRFGMPAVASSLLLVLVFNIDYLIVGRRLEPIDLAIYQIAFRLPQTTIIYVFYSLSAVAFPLFSVARTDRGRLERGYLTSIRLQSTYGAAVGIGILTTAPMLILALFGTKWSAAIVPLEAIAIYAVFRSFSTGAGDVYKAIGRPQLSLWLAGLRFLVLAPALWIAADPDRLHAINVVSWTQAAVAFVMAVIMQGVASRVLGVGLRKLGAAFVPAIAVGVGTAAGVLAVRFWVPLDNTSPLKLLAAIVAGGVVGLGTLWVTQRRFFNEMLSLVRRRTPK